MDYGKFRPDFIEASAKDLPNTIKDSMFKLDSFESFDKYGLSHCGDLLEHITNVLKYCILKCMKTSFVLLYLHKRGKLPDKILDDKLDAQLLDLRRVYLKYLEESIIGTDFIPTIEFQKASKVESQMVKLADKCDEIHEAFNDCYLFSSYLRRNVDVERCKEAPKVFKLISIDDLNVQLLVKSFLEKFQTSLPDALLIPFDINESDPLEKTNQNWE